MASSGRLVDYVGGGLASARPASLSLTPGAIGLFFATDTKALTVWDGDSWEVPAAPSPAWGSITGSIASQTDLADILADKLEDAPSDGQEYVRKDGAWAVATGGGGGTYVPKPTFAVMIPEMKQTDGQYCRFRVPYDGQLNDAGFGGTLSTPPTTTRSLSVTRNGSYAGTISISNTGVFTTSLGPVNFVAGDIFRIDGDEDTAAKNIGLTFAMS